MTFKKESQQLALAAHQNTREKEYWLSRLASLSLESVKDGIPRDLHLKPASDKDSWLYDPQRKTISIPALLLEQLQKTSGGNSHALHMVLTAGVILLLSTYRFEREKDITVGIPIYKQSAEKTFINTAVVIRSQFDFTLSFKELLLKVRQDIIAALEHQNYPLEILAQELGAGSLQDPCPLFDAAIMVEEIHDPRYLDHLDAGLIFSFSATSGTLTGQLIFNRSCYSEQTAARAVSGLVHLLQSALADVDAPLWGMDFLTGNERQTILEQFSGKVDSVEYGVDQQDGLEIPVHRLFEQHAAIQPDDTALVYRGKTLTYGELNRKANDLAAILRRKGVTSNHIVAIMVDYSFEMISGVLAILKAGAGYLPVNPDTPPNRVRTMLRDSGALLLLTKECIAAHFSYMTLLDLEASSDQAQLSSTRPQVEDLDALQMPDRSSIDYEKYRPYIGQAMVKNSITIHMSRGCVYRCAYCFKIWPKKYVLRSAQNIFDEIYLYYQMGVRRFAFVDDLPNIDMDVSSKVYHKIIEHGLKVHLHFPNGIRGDILTEEYIDLMVAAGTITMDLALETTSPRLQKLIRKNLNLEKLAHNIKYITEKHPHVILELQIIHGLPSETEEEAVASLEFIKNIRWVHFPYIHVLNIYPLSDMAEIAVAHGVPREAIARSADLAYHELPETLPFSEAFTRQYQSDFLNRYFLNPERLRAVLPHQMKVLTEDELVQKYNSYLPVDITSFAGLLEYTGISRQELNAEFLPEDYGVVDGLNRKLAAAFAPQFPTPQPGALNVLLLDLSQYFEQDTRIMYDVVEPPLGLMYVLTHLRRTHGSQIHGKIAKSRIDFSDYNALKALIDQFRPDVIGIRTLNFYRSFFHQTIACIRQWGFDGPLIAGGPYATSNYPTMLKDRNIDLAVIGEGEITFSQLIGHILKNRRILPQPPAPDVLATIPGLAYIPKPRPGVFGRTREVLSLDQLPLPQEPGTGESDPEPAGNPGDLAYVIYTSGSSGTPKGVMIDHGSLANQLSALRKELQADSSMRYLLLAAFTFDVSLMHIFLPLTSGARLYLIDEDIRKDSAKLWQFIHENQISILNIVPTFMSALLENIEKKKIAFKTLFVGGDVFPPHLYRGLTDTFRVDQVINIYGPTETTINALMYRIPKNFNGGAVPIGRPLTNYRIYILDHGMNPLPVGAAGELCIAGRGLARGYLNRPELTANRFLNYNIKETTNTREPYSGSQQSHAALSTRGRSIALESGVAGTRLYRSGDLARWLPDGNVHYIGRIDRQVKIRGFRIELGEIEKKLKDFEGIKDALVIVRQSGNGGGDKSIYAYIIPQRSEDFAIETTVIRNRLAEQLPDYMIPAYFISIPRIPVTPGGKIDKKQLPEPKITDTYVAPRNDVENRLVELWGDVLGKPAGEVGIDTNFFELGGHSLRATILISRIQKAFEVKIPLIEFFNNPSVRRLADYIGSAARQKTPDILPVEKKEYYPLSSAQKRLFFLNKMEPGLTVYNMPEIVMLPGSIQPARLNSVFHRLIQRHESLRTSFTTVAEQPVQIVHDSAAFEIQQVETLDGFVRPFQFEKAPLMRAALYRPQEGPCVLLVDLHHIITDGVSREFLIDEFTALIEDRPLTPEYLPLQYKDFVSWLERTKSGRVREQERFWLEQFTREDRPELPLLNLPTDYARPTNQSFEGQSLRFALDAAVTGRLKDLARRSGATLFMALLALYDLFLFRLTGQQDIVVGTGVAGRRHKDVQHIMGLFVNTLALRGFPSPAKSFRQLLDDTRTNTLRAFENQEYPFEELVEKAAVQRDTSRNPLFDTMLQMQDVAGNTLPSPEPEKRPDENPGTSGLYLENRVSKFDLTLFCEERGDALICTFEYCTRLFKAGTINAWIDIFRGLAAAVGETPDRTLEQLTGMPDHRREELIRRLNDGLTGESQRLIQSFPAPAIQQVLENQFNRFKDDDAVQNGATILTYDQLDRWTASLAHQLKVQGLGKHSIIGVPLQNRLHMVVAMIAIFKIRAIFVPLDTTLPPARLENMKKSANISAVINPEQLTFNDASPGGGFEHANAEDPVYVYFTSGSTGTPRAMLGWNQGLLHFPRWEIETLGLTPGCRVSQLTAPTFDAFLRDVLVPLMCGGTMCIPEREEIIKDGGQLLNWLEQMEINLVHCVPGIFRLITREESFNGNRLSHLNYILMSGEPLHPSDLVPWFSAMADRVQLVNLWGTSETTLAKTAYFVEPEDVNRERLPVGKPLPGAEVVVLDDHLNPLDTWQTGDLYIKTPFRTLGYLDQPELTAQRFIQDPFTMSPSPTGFDFFHRTGDIGRKLTDGHIDVLGRSDRQVKIRGIRVELEEIESICVTHPGVSEAVVLKHEAPGGGELLCVYLVLNANGSLDNKPDAENLVVAFLTERLPAYMVPAHVRIMESFPRRSSGKVDYEKLPHPLAEHADADRKDSHRPPGDKAEEQLLALWSEILSVEPGSIAMDATFFQLGGHSLNVMTLISRIHRQMDVRLTLSQVFNNPTIETQAQLIRQTKGGTYASIQAVEQKEYYPQSPAQRRLYLLYRVDPEAIVYNMTMMMAIEGDIDSQLLQQTFEQLIRRHEMLRTSFEEVSEQPVQRIHRQVNFSIQYLQPAADSADFVQPFDLSLPPLLRVGLQRLNDGNTLFIMDMHHIVSDDVSMDILVKDFMALYTGQPCSPLSLHYKDYSEWYRCQKSQTWLHSQSGYWREQFNKPAPVLALHYDYQRPEIQVFQGASISFELPGIQTEKLAQLIQSEDVTMYMLLLSIYTVFLAKWSSGSDIVVGTPVAGRFHADLEKMMGMFVNMLPLRVFPTSELTFCDYLQEVKRIVLDAFENQAYPYEDILEEISVKRDTSRNPLFDVVFSMHNRKVQPTDSLPGAVSGLTVKPWQYENTTSKFDLTLYALESGSHLLFTFEYCTALFKPETIRRYIQTFQHLVASIADEPDRPLEDISLMNAEQQEELLAQLNAGLHVSYPVEKTIHQMFEEQAARTPDHIALLGAFDRKDSSGRPDRSMQCQKTYKELKRQTDEMTCRVQEQGIGSGDIVAIKMERSLDMIVAILAILQSGAAYLPIDPAYPGERIDYMLKDSAARLLIDHSFQSEKTKALTSPLHSGNNRSSSIPAYIIYTSGSTGKPKGVMVEHRNVVRLLFNDAFPFDFNPDDVWSLFHSISFDFSVWEIFGALLYGGKLVVVPKEIAGDAREFAGVVLNHRVSILNQIPGIFINVSAEILKKSPPDAADICVRCVIFGGEALNPVTLKTWHTRFPATRFVNMYGITETTVHVTYKEIGDREINEGKSNIGTPIPTLSMFILDQGLKLVPPGVTGEIAVGGAGVARGYLNRPDLSAERFVSLPFTSNPSLNTIYLSGDLGMLTHDGDVIYLGRKDLQVKIRGFRIELGEIENRVLSHPAVKEAVIVARKEQNGNDRYLCAYIVEANKKDAPAKLQLSLLREYLGRELPDYMIPSFFVPLERLPLTASGKVDRKALPDPQGMDMTSGSRYTPPRNTLEQQLVEIWQEVLSRTNIGIHDDFFEIGGHSLKATRVIARIYERLKVKISLLDVFQYSTVAELAAIVNALKPGEFQGITALEKQEYYEPSHSQKRLWVLDQLEEDQLAYNIPGGYFMEGDLNIPALSQAVEALIARHESLRTRFLEVDGQPKQYIHPADEHNEKFKMRMLDLSQSPDYEKEMSRQIGLELSTSFDLAAGPLFRSQLLLLPGSQFLLLVNMHHIVADGWSMDILVNDLVHFYNSYCGEPSGSLPELRIQYKDYAAWQNKELAGAKLEDHQQYWLSRFRGELPVLQLVTDTPRPANKTYHGAEIEFRPDRLAVNKLRTLCLDRGATLFMGVLSILYTLFYRYTSQQDIILGAPAGERQFSELENQVGCYLNTLALRTIFSGGDSFTQLLERVKETTLGAFEHQVYPFDHLVDQLDLKRDMSRSPLFDVLVVMQNAGIAQNSESKGMTGVEVSSYRGAREAKISKFDMSFYFIEIGEELLIQVNYNISLFQRQRIQRLAAHFSNLLEAIVENPGIDTSLPLYALDYLDKEEKKSLLETLNDNDTAYPSEKTIQAVFQDQVLKTPGHTALVSGGERAHHRLHFSYRQISLKAGGLAALLRTDYSICPGDRVALWCDRSPIAIIALLAVLEIGAAFVPIDTNDPGERIRYILQDSNCKIIITDRDETTSSPEVMDLPLTVLNLSTGALPIFENEQPLDTMSLAQPGDISYIVYTSGSTGRPKGVLTAHRAFNNFIAGLRHVYYLHPRWRFLLTSSLTFDASYRQIFLPLTIGAQLHLLKEPSDVKPLLRYINLEHIGVLYESPAMWREIVNEVRRSGEPAPALTFASSSGDVLAPDLANRIKAMTGEHAVVNMYGPTETCMVAMHYPVEAEQKYALPLGQPFPNYKVYVLDAFLQTVPAGVAGEICIAGPGVARGYLNQPQLTFETFVHWPPDSSQPFPIYKTGDIGVLDIFGNLMFLGRRDAQVKVRGVRIELGEIETVISRFDDIRDVVAVPVKDQSGDTCLAAYYIRSDNTRPVQAAELRARLSTILPTHMIPAYLVPMETFPLTNSGKIDRSALPDPQLLVEDCELAYLPPRNELEKRLADAWEKVLERSKIGITDDFFDYGGDSLKAIRLIGLLSRQLDKKIRLRELFRYPTIAKFAQYISGEEQAGEIPERAGFYIINNHYPQTHTVVCFPPMIGFAFNFHRLKEVIRHPLVLFNMLFESMTGEPVDDNEELLEEFQRQIQLIDIKGPLVLVGWSAGGKLAYEVCRILEKHNVKVDKLLLIDANKIIIKVDENYKKRQLRTYESRLREANTPEQEIRDSLTRMSRYYEFCMNIDHTIKVNADIVVIASEKSNMNQEGLPDMPNLITEDTRDKIGTKWWGDLTNGTFQILMGHGLHREMLDEQYVEDNARIINNIIFAT